MVILMARNGQLCNRLFTISAFVANALEHKYPLVCNSFDDYENHFNLANCNAAPYSISFVQENQKLKNYFLRFLAKISYRLPQLTAFFSLVPYHQNGNINNPLFIKLAQNKKLVVRGWPFWDVENFEKHSHQLREIFTPNRKYMEKAANFLAPLQAEFTVLVGVHIRRGDYIHHVKGRFFFSFETYQHKMEVLYTQLTAAGQKAAFVICSDEALPPDWDLSLPCFTSSNDALTDLMILSKCDYIVGPPSTFSMWASFYGNVPYKNFFCADETISIADFSPIVAPSTHANGTVLKDVYETYSA